MNKQLVSLFFIILLAIYFAMNFWRTDFQNNASQPQSAADYYFRNVSIKQFSASGFLENEINAQKFEHFKRLKLSHIDEPQITVNTPQKNGWQISAERAQYFQSSNQISLLNRVIIEPVPSDNYQNQTNKSPLDGTRILTSQLSFDIEQGIAETETGVTIYTADTQTSANQMTADLKRGLVTLSGEMVTRGGNITHD